MSYINNEENKTLMSRSSDKLKQRIQANEEFIAQKEEKLSQIHQSHEKISSSIEQLNCLITSIIESNRWKLGTLLYKIYRRILHLPLDPTPQEHRDKIINSNVKCELDNIKCNLNELIDIELNHQLNVELQLPVNLPSTTDAQDAQKFCPVCQNFVSYFKTKGQRHNADCPVCGSLERHRLVWLYFQEKTNLFNDKVKLLHFAPEKCIKHNLLKYSNIDYLSADISSPLAEEKVDIQSMKFDDNSFDIIYCSHVLEHIPDDRKAMKELHRVMKPTGWAILMVPIRFGSPKTLEDPNIKTPEERVKYYGQSNHLRYYGLDFKDRLEEAGFNVKVEDYIKVFDEASKDKYGLPKKDYIYFCTK